jgi:hypothetical protein
MKFSSPIDKNGLAEEILRLCNCTNTVYSNYAMVAHLNDALDRYWFLATQAAEKGSFDDSNIASIPVETQSLVSGTNSYKMTSFTNEVLQILRLSILDDNALELDLAREEFDDIEDFNELYSTDSADQGVPQYWTKKGDYIYIRPCPNYSETNGLRAYVNREMSKFTWTPFTVTIASPGVFSATAHGLSGLDGLIFETDGALPTGLTADTTVYYVITAGYTADAFEVSTSYSLTGTAVNTSVSQSGNHKFLKTNKEPGIPVIHHLYLAKHAALAFINQKHPNFQKIFSDVTKFEQDIMDYWRTMESENNAIIKPKNRSFR